MICNWEFALLDSVTVPFVSAVVSLGRSMRHYFWSTLCSFLPPWGGWCCPSFPHVIHALCSEESTTVDSKASSSFLFAFGFRFMFVCFSFSIGSIKNSGYSPWAFHFRDVLTHPLVLLKTNMRNQIQLESTGCIYCSPFHHKLLKLFGIYSSQTTQKDKFGKTTCCSESFFSSVHWNIQHLLHWMPLIILYLMWAYFP